MRIFGLKVRTIAEAALIVAITVYLARRQFPQIGRMVTL